MISIENKTECCGCASCVQACPQKCISFAEDREGFRYPKVSKNNCIDCGICEKVCPILQGKDTLPREPLAVHAAKNMNEQVRLQSSSGGIFTLLAERVINQGGVVFGARFDERWEVVHDYTETIEGLAAFRGSKYVQSRIEDNFQKTKAFLNNGRKVLFSGTPCQIAGLRGYLKKEYDNLLCVDIVCHGVPSPKVWRSYLKDVTRKKDNRNAVLRFFSIKPNVMIENINFRDKSKSWKGYSFIVTLSEELPQGGIQSVSRDRAFYEDSYMKLFLNNVILRPSCYDCKFRNLKSGSDITIGDFWGIDRFNPQFDDDKGVSLVLVNTEKGEKCYPANSTESFSLKYEDSYRYNPVLLKSCIEHPSRNVFFKILPLIKRFEGISNLCIRYKPTIFTR